MELSTLLLITSLSYVEMTSFSFLLSWLGGFSLITLSTRLLVKVGTYSLFSLISRSFSLKILLFTDLLFSAMLVGEFTAPLFLRISLTLLQILLACAQMEDGLKMDLLFSSFLQDSTRSDTIFGWMPTLLYTESSPSLILFMFSTPYKESSWLGLELEWLLFLELAHTLPSIQDMSFIQNHRLTFSSMRTYLLFSCLRIRIVPLSVDKIIYPPSDTVQSVMHSLSSQEQSTTEEKLVMMILFLLVSMTMSHELLRATLMDQCSSSSWERVTEPVLRFLVRLQMIAVFFSQQIRLLLKPTPHSTLYWFSTVSPYKEMHFILPLPQISSLFANICSDSIGISSQNSLNFTSVSPWGRYTFNLPASSPIQTKSSWVSKVRKRDGCLFCSSSKVCNSNS